MGAWLKHPARVIPLAYLGAITAGTGLLLVPWATQPGEHTGVLQAAFTSVSAVCVTGLTTVDTATHWTNLGQFLILLLIQVGGFGIMSLATMVAVVATGRVGVQGSLVAQNELHARSLADVARMPLMVGRTMLVTEAAVALVLTLAFHRYSLGWGQALWYGVFHAVSAFNNAGFALFTPNLIGFIADIWIIGPICLAVIAGGMGFPVYFELFRRRRVLRPSQWSVHARLTVWGTLTLLVLGGALFAAFEWTNPATLGPLQPGGKLVGALGGTVFPRTAGFNSIDYGKASEATILLNYVLMFIGGGSAGTAGGIKVGTAVLLFAVIVAEIRGEPQTVIAHRAIPVSTQRQALSVALLSVGAIAAGTIIIEVMEPHSLTAVAFETISAFATVGATMGITSTLGAGSQLVLMGLMFLGRVGTISVASALMLNRKHRRFRLPEETPIVG